MTAYWETLRALRLADLVAYWRLNEAAGTAVADSNDETHPGVAAAVSWGQVGIGDGDTAASFDGSASLIDVYSAPMASDFNGAAGTLLIWLKADPAVWVSSSHFIAALKADSNNYVTLAAHYTNGFIWTYRAGGTSSQRLMASSATDWHCLALTWDAAEDEVRAYFDGEQQGVTLTSLGTWAGSLASTTAALGSQANTPSLTWKGLLAHAALWDAALTPAEIASLMTLPFFAVTDRAWSDITGRTAKGFFNVSDWVRIDGNTSWVQADLLTSLGLDVTLTDLTPPTITTIPAVSDLNSLIENIDLLREAVALPAATGIVTLDHDYQSGPAATVPNYEDVNDWERDLELMYTYIPTIATYRVYCGVANAGQPRFWQTGFRG